VAVSLNNIEIVKLLLQQPGININAVDAFEFTPLKEASLKGFVEVAKLLRDNGGVIAHRDLGYKVCNLGAYGSKSEMDKLTVQELNTAD